MDVGVRDLKAQLSSWLRRAAAGEQITITDRGTPIATLGPLLGHVDLSEGIEQGWVQAPTADGLGPARRVKSDRVTVEVLAEDRGS